MLIPHFDGDSFTTRAGLIGVLTLLLLWPIGQVSGLGHERPSIRETERDTIAARVGARQWIAGLLLRVPVQRRRSDPHPTATTVWEDVEPL